MNRPDVQSLPDAEAVGAMRAHGAMGEDREAELRHSSPEPVQSAEEKTVSPEPQFGLLEVIEAFTALRHESRGQIVECRGLSDSVQAASTQLQALESRIAEQLSFATDRDPARSLVNVILDLDTQLGRAVEAVIAHREVARKLRADDVSVFKARYNGMNFLVRWFSQNLHAYALQILRGEHREEQPDTALEGLRLLVARLRRLMDDQAIERCETVGLEFDGEFMTAISAMKSDGHASGVVVEQLTPAYFWMGQHVRFAEVRVAK